MKKVINWSLTALSVVTVLILSVLWLPLVSRIKYYDDTDGKIYEEHYFLGFQYLKSGSWVGVSKDQFQYMGDKSDNNRYVLHYYMTNLLGWNHWVRDQGFYHDELESFRIDAQNNYLNEYKETQQVDSGNGTK